jgi:hypothetical protein
MNSKHNRLFMLAVLLMTIILLSLFIGTNLFAKPNNSNKPENPGKPEEPPLEEDGTDFKIWIGTGNLDPPEDVVLQPYGNPEQDYLLACRSRHDNCDEGIWLPLPSKKGNKPQSGGWDVFLGAVNLRAGEEPEYAGTYDVTNQGLIDKLAEIGFYPIEDKEALDLMMVHYITDFWNGHTSVDFWRFTIQWQVDPSEIPNNHVYQLEGETDMGPEPESEYDELTDTWTVFFDNVNFGFAENTAEEGWALETYWEGPLSFTVKIKRILL